MGKDRMIEFSPCSPAFRAVLTRDGGGEIWRVQQEGPGGFADRAELENHGWKIITVLWNSCPLPITQLNPLQ
jgi:hypothetical protein